jgi:uncharacterized protein YijF (DUF1287 family)
MAVSRVRSIGLLFVVLFAGCAALSSSRHAVDLPSRQLEEAIKVPPNATPLERLNASAIEQTTITTGYDASYIKLDYPNGDVPQETGVCADVIVRAFRKAGIDLQKELHEDMTRSFSKYPKKWGAKKPDRNIDHRRVPNLMTWFDRQGKSLPVTRNEKDYLPGDVITWGLSDGRPHTGIVSKIKVEGTERYAVVHNIGLGARLEDVLFEWGISGHYRYFDAVPRPSGRDANQTTSTNETRTRSRN